MNAAIKIRVKGTASVPMLLQVSSDEFSRLCDGGEVSVLRPFGPRWNADNCPPGRPVIAVQGYGPTNRRNMQIVSFRRARGCDLSSEFQSELARMYGADALRRLSFAVIQLIQ